MNISKFCTSLVTHLSLVGRFNQPEKYAPQIRNHLPKSVGQQLKILETTT